VFGHVEQLKTDEAMPKVDTLLLTVPNQGA
jgi:hypothetical protein